MTDGWHTGELIGLDFETTGIDRAHDVPVSYALVRARATAVVGREHALVDPGRPIPPAATAIHKITTEQARAEGVPLAAAIGHVAGAVLDAGRRGVPVVGMNLAFDLSILDVQLRRLEGEGLVERGWSGPVLDVLVLDRHFDRFRSGKRRLENLCAHYGVAVDSSHDASDDAASALGVLFALCARYPALVAGDLDTLTAAQATWHREWATGYSRWRTERGLPALTPDEHSWPLGSAATGGQDSPNDALITGAAR